jgi:lysophospholipase L1-like esterase
MSLPFKTNDLILFTGDSITDCDRDRTNPDSLGTGYVNMVADRLRRKAPELNLRFRNTGIGGDRTKDLLARWDRDCIGLQPNWVSILVGVNNTWRRYDTADHTTDAQFEVEYRELLQRIKDNTDARIILCSPFLLHVDSSVEGMREDLNPKISIIRNLAEEYGALWVDFDAAFVAAEQRHIPSYWAGDGVHPTQQGYALMAETWLAAVGA